MPRKLALLAATVLLTLCIAEVSLRLFDYFRGIDSEYRALWYWGFRQDRYLGYRARESVRIKLKDGSLFDTNREGYRDSEFDDLVNNNVIVALGESSTWGIGSSDKDHTWPKYLEKVIRGSGNNNWRVINAGLPGYTTLENVQLLSLRMLKYKPKVVLYMGFFNDYRLYGTSLDNSVDVNMYARSLALVPCTTINEIMMRSSLVAFLVGRLAPYLHYDNQLGSKKLQIYSSITTRATETIRNNIALMNALCVRNNAKLVWVDQPVDYSVRAADMDNIEMFRKVVHDECKHLDIPMLKAHEEIGILKSNMVDDVHFNDKGYELLAGIIYTQLGFLLQ
jgi:lysophospholipase L1-like esterase